MKTWHCNDPDCEIRFSAELSTTCPRCGSMDISCLGEIASPGPSQCHSGVNSEESSDIFDILKDLCLTAYDTPYMSSEWEAAIKRARERLEPFIVVK